MVGVVDPARDLVLLAYVGLKGLWGEVVFSHGGWGREEGSRGI